MKHLVRMLTVICLAALIGWLGPALVRNPDAAAPQQDEMPVLALWQPAAMPQNEAVPMPEPAKQIKVAAVIVPQQACAAVSCAQCDGNGWPITGRTWPRTVYAVCPPEGMPG